MRLLLIEDEPKVADALASGLEEEGFRTSISRDGVDGCHRALTEAWDLVILDLFLPGMNGLEVLRRLRRSGHRTRVLILTAQDSVEDRVRGLEAGADDYLAKPFEPQELLARAGALLRRVRKEALTPVLRFEFGDVQVDFARGEVLRGGARVNLAAKELQLLRFLVDHRGQVVSRDVLLRSVWSQQPYITPRTVDTHVAWLRQKLEPNPQTPRHILTVRGEGYRFER